VTDVRAGGGAVPIQSVPEQTSEAGGAPVARAIRELQTLFPDIETKLLATVVVLFGLVAAAVLIRRLGSPLKRKFEAEDVEAVEAALFAVAATVAAVMLVVIWEAVGRLWNDLQSVLLTPRQGALMLIAGLALVIAFTLSQITQGVLERRQGDIIDRHRREAIRRVVQIAVYVGAGAFVLTMAGVDPGNLVVGAGAAGVIIGLAARQTLGSVFAGFVLLFSRPFEIGDWIEIDGQEGIVTEVTLFNTRLRTFADEHVVIPNDEVTAGNIVNRSTEGRLRVSVDVGVDYDTDIQRAARLARDAMEGVDEVIQEPHPHVVMKEFDDSSVVLECRFWITDPSARRRWVARSSVIDAVKRAFEGDGVKIPFPQRELSGRGEAGFRIAEGEPIQPPADPETTTDDETDTDTHADAETATDGGSDADEGPDRSARGDDDARDGSTDTDGAG